MLFPLRNMAKLPFHSLLKILAYFLSFTTIINLSSSARTFENPTQNRHHSHHKLSFLMRDVLNVTPHPSSKSPTTKANAQQQLPFSKPLGFFPPNGGIPIPETYTTTTSPITEFSTQTPDLSTIGISFPARATLQELEYGVVRGIDEELFETSRHKSRVVTGRIEGFYVENGEDSGGHMMAMTIYFGKTGEAKDGLRLFGVYRSDRVKESHVAIIGGIGKYLGANGYATLKKSVRAKFGVNYNKFIELNVYLSK